MSSADFHESLGMELLGELIHLTCFQIVGLILMIMFAEIALWLARFVSGE